MEEQIYIVKTEGDVEGKSTVVLGYCTGKKHDIETFFESKKAYSLIVEPIKVMHITSQTVKEYSEKLAQINKLQLELALLERDVKIS